MRRAIATLCCVIVGLQLFALGTLVAAGALLLFAGTPVGIQVPYTTSEYSAAPHYVSDSPHMTDSVPASPYAPASPLVPSSPYAPSPPPYPTDGRFPMTSASVPPVAPTGEVATLYEPDASLPPAESKPNWPAPPRPFRTPAPTLSAPEPRSSPLELALVPPAEVESPPSVKEESATAPSPADRDRFDDMLASRQELGSPLDGSLLADGNDAADEALLVQMFKQLAGNGQQQADPQPAAQVPHSTPNVPARYDLLENFPGGPAAANAAPALPRPQEGVAHAPPLAIGPSDLPRSPDSMPGAIQEAARQLYALAERHEHESQNWDRADQLRQLARTLHRELNTMATEDVPWNRRVPPGGQSLPVPECEGSD